MQHDKHSDTQLKSSVFIPDVDQQAVIDIAQGCHLVLAPPGCGKTQILTERIKNTLSQGVCSDDMLCLTFTNRAARGMTERIRAHIADESASNVFVGNVHRFCAKFLFEQNLIAANASIIDDEDAISILSHELNEEESEVWSSFNRRREYAAVIQLSALMYQIAQGHPKELRLHPDCLSSNDICALRALCEKQQLPFDARSVADIYMHTELYAEAAKAEAYDYGTARLIDVLLRKMTIARRYIAYKQANHLLDFEDLLLFTYDAFKGEQAADYKRYTWIQVDEVQDLNPLQLAIVDALTAPTLATVLYLGDEQQAIFSFMGAKMSTLALLKQRCAGKIHHLHTNHRAPKYLLEVLNSYAEKVLGIDKDLLPDTPFVPVRDGNELRLQGSGTAEEELKDVCDCTKALLAAHPSETTAIIVSSNNDADAVSQALAGQGVAHFKVSGEDLFACPTVKLLFAHLNVVANEYHFIAWARVIKGLRIVDSNTAAQNLVRALMERAMTPADLMRTDGSTYLKDFISAFETRDIVVFDTETTGLNVFEDDIVQIAATKIRKGCADESQTFQIFIRTDKEIPAMLGELENPLIEALKLHTLHAPAEALQRFLAFVGDAILLGHNATFDYQILANNLRRYLPSVSLAQLHPDYFDTLKLVRLLRPDLKNYKLKNLLEELQLEGENTHLADADVQATVNLVHFCYEQAIAKASQQDVFLAHPKVAHKAALLRNRYAEAYHAAHASLYNKVEQQSTPLLVEELLRFYHFLLSNEQIKPLAGMGYITTYLSQELIDPKHERCLAEQLHKHCMEINTLKEADLCGSAAVQERVFVSTVHKAKGLEFDNVIIFDAVEGRYPNYYNKDNPALLLEDARKFYVALSRARKRLVVAWSSVRLDYYNNPQPRYLTRFMMPIAALFN